MGLLSHQGLSCQDNDRRPRIDMEYSEVLRKLARINRALRVSRRLLDSVAFVAKEGDTEGPLSMLDKAEADCAALREAI